MAFLFSLNIWAQQTDVVDFKTAKGEIEFIPEEKTVEGKVSYTFKTKKDADSIFLDARAMKAELIAEDSMELKTTKKKIWLISKFKAKNTYTVDFSYKTKNPKKALYFVGWNNAGSNQIWSQGQGHHTSHWLPSIDDKKEKIIFDLIYKTSKAYTVIGNGQLISHDEGEKNATWHYKMKNPMSSYLVAVAIGNYCKKEIKSAKDTPIELYYEPKDSAKIEPTYRYTQEIFDFLEKEIGVDYPWENYKQVPVRDFLYAGMENTSTTIFAESFMTDSIGFLDQNYVNVNAHELAHQWFGNLVTEESSADHWLQEGFATYYALLAEKELFGSDYFYFHLFKNAEELKSKSDEGKGEALTDPEAGSLTFYEKGAWAVHILREHIGDTAFKEGIKNYLENYAFKNATVEDFIKQMEKSSGEDLSDFKQNWLNQTAFQADEALNSLKHSSFIKKYMEVAAVSGTPLEEKYEAFLQIFDQPINKYIGQEIVYQLAGEPESEMRLELYQKAFNTNDMLIRQAISNSLTEIPKELKAQYESLLKDDSYLTQEQALFNLWSNFPENRTDYLDILKDTQGFYDKNIRLLWLTLSLVTQDYHPEENQVHYEELSGYTAPEFDYSIRQNAFGHLYQINVFSEQNYKDLMQSTTHPVWRYRKFAKELLEELLKESEHKSQLKALKGNRPKKQQKVLEKSLEEIE